MPSTKRLHGEDRRGRRKGAPGLSRRVRSSGRGDLVAAAYQSNDGKTRFILIRREPLVRS